MFKILTYNHIAAAGLERLSHDRYETGSEVQHPDAILLRSHSLHGMSFPPSLKAIGRAGVGVNNIPVAECSQRGIPVFIAPGANANAVKELVIGGLILASRNLCGAWSFVMGLDGAGEDLEKAVEQGKKRFAGFELQGKCLGVLGLGAIGVRVANAAMALGMRVVGYDPAITVQSAWQLSAQVDRALSVDDLLSRAEFLTLHVPLSDKTRALVNEERLQLLRPRSVLLNFSRAEVVDERAVLAALDSGRLHAYVTDFPSAENKRHPRVIALPHIGASTAEAEENSAVQVVETLRDFLENGNIRHSVNFPEVTMPRVSGATRIGVAHLNMPGMVSQICQALSDAALNIGDLLNKSTGDVAYTLVDVEGEMPASVMERICGIEGIAAARIVGHVG